VRRLDQRVEQKELAWGKKLEAAVDLAYQAPPIYGYLLIELKNSYCATPLALALEQVNSQKPPLLGNVGAQIGFDQRP
jgi:hypothetical protein